MSALTVHLGFEVGSADPVEIPIRHMAVTGQTQESGKTTTLEALITRSGLPAIAFLTKRGEGSMHGRQILPYFEDRADWRFVQSILESTMHEKMKFERAWIVRACQGARTLAGVQTNLIKLEENARNALSKDVYMLLGEYLRRVVPMIEKLPKGGERQMQYLFGEVHNGAAADGLSIMDLTAYPLELQMLVISSTLEWIHRHGNGVISIIPEAWKFIPQGRNTPVRIAVENLMREGAVLKNYVWIDSQDMGAVDKALLRSVPVCLIGVQREANELKRTLANMPEGLKKPKAGDVATLGLGEFFACFGKSILKVYVQPAWMDEKAGKLIASGRLDVHVASLNAASKFSEATHPLPRCHHGNALRDHSDDVLFPSCGCTTLQAVEDTPNVKQPAQAGTRPVESPAGSSAIALDSSGLRTSAIEEEEEEVMSINQEAVTALRMAIQDGAKHTALQLFDGIFGGNPVAQAEPLSPVAFAQTPNGTEPSVLSDALYSQILSRLLQDLPDNPRVLQLLTRRPEIEVKVQRQFIPLDSTSLRGRLAVLIAEDFFRSVVNGNSAFIELKKRGVSVAKPSVYKELDKLTEMGFLLKLDNGYQVVPGMNVSKKTIEAAA